MDSDFRVIVTGSRTWREPERIFDALTSMAMTTGDFTLMHGDCPQGADHYARLWATRQQFQSNARITEERHPADWETYGRAAGFIRNQEMVDAGANVVLAFVDVCRNSDCFSADAHPSHGAEHCMKMAKKANIEVIPFWSDGENHGL